MIETAITSLFVWVGTQVLATGWFWASAALLIGATYLAYIAAMRLRRRKQQGRLEWYHWLWAGIVLPPGLLLDFTLNIVVGLLFGELPQWRDQRADGLLDRELLLTGRLDRWARGEDGPESMGPFRSQPRARRKWFGRWTCRYLLNPWDEDHCHGGG